MEASEVPLLEARVLILSSSVLDAPLPIMDGLAGLRRAARLTEVTGFVVAIIVKKTAGGGRPAVGKTLCLSALQHGAPALQVECGG